MKLKLNRNQKATLVKLEEKKTEALKKKTEPPQKNLVLIEVQQLNSKADSVQSYAPQLRNETPWSLPRSQ